MSTLRLMRVAQTYRHVTALRDLDTPASDRAREVTEPTDLERAEALYRQRRLRASAFSSNAVFHDPAWDLILDLFIAHSKGQTLSVTGACEGASLPSSTGLRWLRTLEARKMISCGKDPNDRRRRLVTLLPETVRAMRTFLKSL